MNRVAQVNHRLHQGMLWVRLALAVIFAAWIFFVVGNPSPKFPTENSAEARFTRDMMTHHAQAVDMASRIRDVSSDPELRTLAFDIVLTQQNQVGQMQAWLNVWNLPQAGLEAPMQGMAESMGMLTQEQLNILTNGTTLEAEVRFLQWMIRHHEGGVMMAQNIIGDSKNSLIKQLAQSIVNSQTSEIAYMESLLDKRESKRLEPLSPMTH